MTDFQGGLHEAIMIERKTVTRVAKKQTKKTSFIFSFSRTELAYIHIQTHMRCSKVSNEYHCDGKTMAKVRSCNCECIGQR